MKASIVTDPNGPRAGVEANAKLLEILPRAGVVIITLIMTKEGEFNLPLVLSAEALDKVRPVLIEEALKFHKRSEEILAEHEKREVRTQ